MIRLKTLHDYRIKKLFATCLRALAKLQVTLFDFYIKRHWMARYPAYEKKLYHQRMTLLHRLQHLRRVTNNKKDKKIMNGIEHLHEIICSLHQLRFRVSDYSIFEICDREMTALQKTTRLVLLQLSKTSSMQTAVVLEKIHAFEAIYHRALHVVAPDPIVFLFFIQNLYAFYDETLELSMIHDKST